jgi:hypothetical protein
MPENNNVNSYEPSAESNPADSQPELPGDKQTSPEETGISSPTEPQPPSPATHLDSSRQAPTDSHSESVKPVKIFMVLLDQLFIPSWNPRKYIDPVEMAELVAYIAGGGWTPRILILKRAEGGWWVISGQRRVLAHRTLQKTHIEAEEMDITLEEAKIMAETSNEGPKPYWLDTYENWETLLDENPDWSARSLGGRLGKPKTLIHRATQIMKLLNPASRAMIRQALNTPASNSISQKPLFFEGSVPNGDTDPENKGNLEKLNEGTARQLIPLLNGRTELEAQGLAEKAVKIVLERGLNASKVTALVSWINAGNPPETFGTSAGPHPRPSHPKNGPTHSGTGQPETSAQSSQAEGQVLNMPIPAVQESGASTSPSGTKQSNHVPPLAGTGQPEVSTQTPSPTGISSPLSNTSAKGSETQGAEKKVSYFWEAMAGVSIIGQIRSRLKKGEKLTGFEYFLVIFHFIRDVAVFFGKPMFQFGKWCLKGLWSLFKKAVKKVLKVLGEVLGKIFEKVIAIVFWAGVLVGIGWLGLDIYQHGVSHPLQLIESKIHFPRVMETTPPLAVENAPVTVAQPPVLNNGTGVTNAATAAPTAPTPAQAVPTTETQPVDSIQPTPATQASSSGNPPEAAAADDLATPLAPAGSSAGPSSATASAANATAPTPAAQKPSNDLAGQVIKQVAPGLAVDAAKKLFGL